MIQDMDKTIREILRKEVQSVKDGQAEISFQQPTREWSTGEGKRPTINLYLYDVRENPHLRTHQWETIVNGQNGLPRSDHAVSQKRTPMRVDCSYMLTTWANDPGDEHRLLSEAMLVLFRYPILPNHMVTNGLTSQPFEIRTQLARHDVLTNPAELWGALDNDIRPSISYVVTLTLDPWTIVTGPAVKTVSFTVGQEAIPSELRNRPLQEDGKSMTLSQIGGYVHEKGSDAKPIAGIEITIEGTGLFTRTDENGRFRFHGLLPADYELVIRPSSGKLIRKTITVPVGKALSPTDKAENYDLEI